MLKLVLEFVKGENGLFTASTKRNLITNSAEYYNLSYEYINDCLRAGLVYRREFYNDSEIEPEHSLCFKLTITPFGDILIHHHSANEKKIFLLHFFFIYIKIDFFTHQLIIKL